MTNPEVTIPHLRLLLARELQSLRGAYWAILREGINTDREYVFGRYICRRTIGRVERDMRAIWAQR